MQRTCPPPVETRGSHVHAPTRTPHGACDAGESYAGVFVPLLSRLVLDENERAGGLRSPGYINLKARPWAFRVWCFRV
jgi:hypothetical protein